MLDKIMSCPHTDKFTINSHVKRQIIYWLYNTHTLSSVKTLEQEAEERVIRHISLQQMVCMLTAGQISKCGRII